MAPRINIDQQRALIGINITMSKLNISTPRPKMKIEENKPQMSIDRENPKFKVNWKKVRNESGLETAHDFTLSIRDKASNNVLQYIGESVSDGNYIEDVSKPGNRIAQVEANRNRKTADPNVAFGSMPKSLPEIEWNPGYMHISWSNHSFEIEWTDEYMPNILVDPKYAVEIFLRNRPYIKVSVDEESLLPTQPGYQIDTVR